MSLSTSKMYILIRVIRLITLNQGKITGNSFSIFNSFLGCFFLLKLMLLKTCIWKLGASCCRGSVVQWLIVRLCKQVSLSCTLIFTVYPLCVVSRSLILFIGFSLFDWHFISILTPARMTPFTVEAERLKTSFPRFPCSQNLVTNSVLFFDCIHQSFER